MSFCPRWNLQGVAKVEQKKQAGVKQTKEILMTTPHMHRFIQYLIKGHTFHYKKRFYINIQLILWLCQRCFSTAVRLFSP